VANKSFEDAGAGSGFALSWSVIHVSDEVEAFGFNGAVAFSAFEGFEARWRLPQLLSSKKNEHAKFAFTGSDIDAMLLSGDEEETFEQTWDIAGVLGATYSAQSVQIKTDGGTWPTGHVSFIDNFSSDAIDVFEFDSALYNHESFSTAWLLPGTIVGKTNTLWFARYYDTIEEEYRFLPEHLGLFSFGGSFDAEGFETTWRSNQNSKFEFVGSDIEQFTFNNVGAVDDAELFNALPGDDDWVLDFDNGE